MKPGVHLAGDGPAVRPRHPIRWEKPRRWRHLVDVLADGQRIPDRHAVVDQSRHQHRGRQQQQFLAVVGVIDVDPLLDDVQPSHPAEQPAAQRPGRIVLGGDRQPSLRHVVDCPDSLNAPHKISSRAAQ